MRIRLDLTIVETASGSIRASAELARSFRDVNVDLYDGNIGMYVPCKQTFVYWQESSTKVSQVATLL